MLTRPLSLQAALITYVTAGFPTAEETPSILIAMEKGGAGMRFILPAPRQQNADSPLGRHHRARGALHRSNCRWTDDPDREHRKTILQLPPLTAADQNLGCPE